MKREIAENLNNGLTFEELYEFDIDGKCVEAYEHFDPSLILQADRVLGKISNERCRYFDKQATLFPAPANKYDSEIIREPLHNVIAHQDYRNSGKSTAFDRRPKGERAMDHRRIDQATG